MPCSDLTELIRVVVDDDDRLLDYRFVKRTCGRAVGAESLLRGELAGMTAAGILALTPEAVTEAAIPMPPEEEFLRLKHLFAVQSALEVLLGRADCGPQAQCAAAQIAWESGQTVIDARIRVDAVHGRIQACSTCGQCPSTESA